MNPCKCGLPPEVVQTSAGLTRVSCSSGLCNAIVCQVESVARQMWDEYHPAGDEPTMPENERP